MHEIAAVVGRLLPFLALAACASAPAVRPHPTPMAQCDRMLGELGTTREANEDPPAVAGKRIAAIEVSGNQTIPEKVIRASIDSRPGKPLDGFVVADDLRRLWALEVFSDVRALTHRARRGLVLEFAVVERPLVGQVFTNRRGGEVDGWRGVELLAGGIYDPAQAARIRTALERHYRRSGYLDAAVVVRGRQRAGGQVDLCFSAASGARFRVGALEFDGNEKVEDATLASAIAGIGDEKKNPSRLIESEHRTLAQQRLAAVYYDHGMIEAVVRRPVEHIDRRRRTISLRFPISEGPVYRIDTILIGGDPSAPLQAYEDAYALTHGDVFSRSKLFETIERFRKIELAHGRKHAHIEPKTELDSENHLVDIQFVIEDAK